MGRLSDFKPLESVQLPDVGEVNSSGLTLIVGPNSSGKSQLLRDIYHSLSGDIRHRVVASQIVVRKPDFTNLINSLVEDGLFTRVMDDNGGTQLMPRTIYAGMGQQVGAIAEREAQNLYNNYGAADGRRPNQFLNHFGRLLVSALFLDRRLTSLTAVGLIDFLNSPPQHDLHALYMSDIARTRLATEIGTTFGKAIWPDISRGSNLVLRVSDSVEIPNAEDRHSPTKMARFRTIEDEGDGMKSYVATCISILLGERPVTLIDEPEMCLHPPQAYNLGRFIGRNGRSTNIASFVSTHSSHILRGVLQETKDLQIIRLTRREGAFHAHKVSASTLRTALAKPTLRAESILDGIFSQCVVAVEAETDRLVYTTVVETLTTEFRGDVHFAPVGGTDGLAGTCELYKTLQIPVAIVADRDVLANADRLQRLLTTLTTADRAAELLNVAQIVLEKIRELPPTITPIEAKSRLEGLAQRRMDWTSHDDAELRRDVSRLSGDLDRMRRLKYGDVPLPNDIQASLDALIDQLSRIGLFVVPVGELEDWLKGYNLTSSRHNKWAWANEAALRIQEAGVSAGDVWDFIRKLLGYLDSPEAVGVG
jgi:hypothetical protein